MVRGELATGNIGIGNTSTLATFQCFPAVGRRLSPHFRDPALALRFHRRFARIVCVRLPLDPTRPRHEATCQNKPILRILDRRPQEPLARNPDQGRAKSKIVPQLVEQTGVLPVFGGGQQAVDPAKVPQVAAKSARRNRQQPVDDATLQPVAELALVP